MPIKAPIDHQNFWWLISLVQRCLETHYNRLPGHPKDTSHPCYHLPHDNAISLYLLVPVQISRHLHKVLKGTCTMRSDFAPRLFVKGVRMQLHRLHFKAPHKSRLQTCSVSSKCRNCHSSSLHRMFVAHKPVFLLRQCRVMQAFSPVCKVDDRTFGRKNRGGLSSSRHRPKLSRRGVNSCEVYRSLWKSGTPNVFLHCSPLRINIKIGSETARLTNAKTIHAFWKPILSPKSTA